MKRKLLQSAALIVLAVTALGLSACSNTDGSGTHNMGGRNQSAPMSDEMMTGHR